MRWQQRFSNFCRALERLDDLFEPPELNQREQQGLIKAFEYSYELGWNTLTAHTDNRATAEAIATNIRERYRPCFHQLRDRLLERQQREQVSL